MWLVISATQVGVAGKRGLPDRDQVQRVQINGMPGFVMRTGEGVEAMALELAGDRVVAVIVRIYAMRNPDKLRHLDAMTRS